MPKNENVLAKYVVENCDNKNDRFDENTYYSRYKTFYVQKNNCFLSQYMFFIAIKDTTDL